MSMATGVATIATGGIASGLTKVATLASSAGVGACVGVVGATMSMASQDITYHVAGIGSTRTTGDYLKGQAEGAVFGAFMGMAAYGAGRAYQAMARPPVVGRYGSLTLRMHPKAASPGVIPGKWGGLSVKAPRGTGVADSFYARQGSAKPIPLHDASTPWYKFLKPKYTGQRWVKTAGRSRAEIARTSLHEAQHIADFNNYPGVTNLAARSKYFPGSGFSRYWLEYRGYRTGGTYKNIFTPLHSFNPPHKRWLMYDIGIFGGRAATGGYSIYQYFKEDE